MHCMDTAWYSENNYTSINEDTCDSAWYHNLTRSKSVRVLASQRKEFEQLNDGVLRFFGSLTLLQVTQTTIMKFPGDLHTLLPLLRVLDVSHDMDNILHVCTDASLATNFDIFLTDVLLFHPSLELFISVNNVGQEVSSKKRELTDRAARGRDVRYAIGDIEDALTTEYADYIFVNDIQAFWQNQTTRCDVIQHYFGLNALPCSCDYISYDPHCLANARMPISPNLQEVYLSNVLYDEYSVGLVWSKSMLMLTSDLFLGESPEFNNYRFYFQPNN